MLLSFRADRSAPLLSCFCPASATSGQEFSVCRLPARHFRFMDCLRGLPPFHSDGSCGRESGFGGAESPLTARMIALG